MNHIMDAVRYAMEGLGRIKQEVSYWDRIWVDDPQSNEINLNKGK